MVAGAALDGAIAALDQRSLERLVRAAPRLPALPRLLPGARSRHRPVSAGIEFEELRAYAPGDDLRQVDWRASARSRAPQVRRYRDERAADWYLVVDCSASMAHPGPAKWLRAVQAALALAYLALQRDDRAALVLVADRVVGFCPPGRGPLHYPALVHTLRRHATDALHGRGSRPAAALSVIQGPASVVVLGDLLRADAMRPDLTRLADAADHLRLVQVLDPAEAELPATAPGPFTLEDAETGERRVAGPEGAGEHLERYVQELAAWCRQRGVVHSRHRSDDHWSQVVLGHLGGRGA